MLETLALNRFLQFALGSSWWALLIMPNANHTVTTHPARASGKSAPSTASRALPGLTLCEQGGARSKVLITGSHTTGRAQEALSLRKSSWCLAHRIHSVAQISGQAALTQHLAPYLQLLLLWEDHGQPPAWLMPLPDSILPVTTSAPWIVLLPWAQPSLATSSPVGKGSLSQLTMLTLVGQRELTATSAKTTQCWSHCC